MRTKAGAVELARRIIQALAGCAVDWTWVGGRPITGTKTLPALKRALNAHRYPEVWDTAVALCRQSRSIEIEGNTVTLRHVPYRLFPVPQPPKKVRRSAGRVRSARDREARRAWLESKTKDPDEPEGENPGNDGSAEPRDDLKAWLYSMGHRW